MKEVESYVPKNKVRIVTAASLFDGHDAAINVMRRIIQGSGVEVVHLGHDRSVQEVVDTAIQEDAQAIAMTSYQGGHNEYFKYMHDLLKEKGAGHIKIFAGGGGVILPSEIKELMQYGITRIYSPDDGREMGLQGMINDLVEKSDFPSGINLNVEVKKINASNKVQIGKLISYSVVLLDEIEKSHPDVFNILLQVFEDGQLTDGLGNTVDFKNAIVIMTSNLGARFLEKRHQLGFHGSSEESTQQKMEELVTAEVKKAFNPEFINRLDEIIIFNSLSDEDLEKIVDLLVIQINESMVSKNIKIALTPRFARLY